MTPLIREDFLLNTPEACDLFEQHARDLPIIDYHCHLDPGVVSTDTRYTEIVDMWLTPDPYKLRAMRIAGEPEELITGSAAPREKFQAWARTVPLLVGNPMFHWIAMELKQFFDIDELLTPLTADCIREACNEKLAQPDLSAQNLIRKSNIETFCTSDVWLDDLQPQVSTQQADIGFTMLPSLRGEQAMAVDDPKFKDWLTQLSNRTQIVVNSFDSFKHALSHLVDSFNQSGCKLMDLGLPDLDFWVSDHTAAESDFQDLLDGKSLDVKAVCRLQSAIFAFLNQECCRVGWALQLHIGAHRSTSSRLLRELGPHGGFACIGKQINIAALSGYLDFMEAADALPQVIIFPLNPNSYEPVASLTGSFVEAGSPGKLQLGPAWWYNDHIDGIERQLRAIMNHGVLGTFIGMTTDSRSLLSGVRHDYFRRILCDILGRWVQEGSLPNDSDLLSSIIRKVCYVNPKSLLS